MNDSLSAAILQQYINELDNSKIYFLASDIQSFDKYKSVIDDLTRKEDVSPAYDIYKVFSKRYAERMDYLYKNLIEKISITPLMNIMTMIVTRLLGQRRQMSSMTSGGK